MRLTNAEAAARFSAGVVRRPCARFKGVDMGRVEQAGADIEFFAGEHEATQAGFAISLGVDQRAEAAEHCFITEEADVGRIALTGRLEVRRRFQPVAGLGEQPADAPGASLSSNR